MSRLWTDFRRDRMPAGGRIAGRLKRSRLALTMPASGGAGMNRKLRHLMIALAIAGVGAALLFLMISDAICIAGAC